MPKASFSHIDRHWILTWRLGELKGFATSVPPLIEAERRARYEALKASTSGADDEDLLIMYESQSRREEGDGHADFERACFSGSIFLAWDLFIGSMARELVERQMPNTAIEKIRQQAHSLWTFPKMKTAWARAGVDLAQLDGWPEIDELRLLRNALAHNAGRYTPEYLASPVARRRQDLEREMSRSLDDDTLIDLFEIPIDVDYVRQRLDRLASFFKEASDTLAP